MSSLTALIYRHVSAKQAMAAASGGYEPPVFAILNSFWRCGKRKVIFPVESARTLGDSCVQSVHCRDSSQHCESFRGALGSERTIIGAPDHHDTVIPLQPIYFIQEKAPDIIRHQTIDIFKDEEARACLPCFLEYRANVFLVTGFPQRFDIQSWDGR